MAKKGKGSGWHGEKRRHEMAAYGILSKRPKTPSWINPETEEPWVIHRMATKEDLEARGKAEHWEERWDDLTVESVEEIPAERDYINNPRQAINKHSIRGFKSPGDDRIFYLDRNLSADPHYYILYYFDFPISWGRGQIARTMEIDGETEWGDGLSWPKAIKVAKQAIFDEVNSEE